jgi:hypothetical protein
MIRDRGPDFHRCFRCGAGDAGIRTVPCSVRTACMNAIACPLRGGRAAGVRTPRCWRRSR